MTHRIAFVIAGLAFIIPCWLGLQSPAYAQVAQVPTPTPYGSETNYSRSNLLASLAPKTLNSTPAFQSVDFNGNTVNTLVEGGSDFRTFWNILTAANVPGIFAAILIGLMLIIWLRSILVNSLRKTYNRFVDPNTRQIIRNQYVGENVQRFKRERRAIRNFGRSNGKSPRRRSRL